MAVTVTARQRKNLTQTAYEEIRAAICDNKIKQGDLLSESALAQELKMSRTPVREALRMLESEDLVEVKNGIGIYVKPISYRDICDLFEVRRSLEILAAKTAVQEISAEEIDLLEQRLHAFLDKHEGGARVSLEEFTRIDWELHELFVERCRNKHVKSIMKGINSNIKRYQSVSFEALNNLCESTEQHLHLLQLVRQRDAAALAGALDKHMEWSIECFLKCCQY